MSVNDVKGPEFLQIKGYKYRAKILLAAAVLLIVLIVLIVLLCRGIASLFSGANGSASSDTYSTVSVDADTDSDIPVDTSIVSQYEEELNAPVSKATSSDVFDADGRLVIDTDVYEGKKVVAITFDDGPSQYTDFLLDGLDEKGAKATFFMVGSCVEQYPDVLPKMVEGGHQLGNHTYNHVDITTVSNNEMTDQINKTDEAIRNACGKVSTAFRPPYGSYNATANAAIDKTITLWSIDTLDWKLNSAEEVKNSIVSKCMDGDIILLHDTHKSSVDGALAAIEQLQKEGFIFVTVDELLTRYGSSIEKNVPHSAQYAVYETNSPYAEKYLKEIREAQEQAAASSAAGSFYSESSLISTDASALPSSDTSTASSSSNNVSSRMVY